MTKRTTEPHSALGLGLKSTAWLAEAGVHTMDDLRALGSVESWRRAKALYPREVSLNLLYALEAALLGTRWDQLPPEIRDELRRQIEAG